MKFTVKLELPRAEAIVRKHGLGPGGVVQLWHTQNVLQHMEKYMPFRNHALIGNTIINSTATEITSPSPYAHYMYMGKVYVDPVYRCAGFMTESGWRSRENVPKVLTDRDLTYDCGKNPRAGPFWDRRLVAAEGTVLVRELQAYIDKGGIGNG